MLSTSAKRAVSALLLVGLAPLLAAACSGAPIEPAVPVPVAPPPPAPTVVPSAAPVADLDAGY